jgi:hypothetical protein
VALAFVVAYGTKESADAENATVFFDAARSTSR